MRSTSILKAILSITVATVNGCDSSAVGRPHDLMRLAQAQERWGARSFTDYSYEIRVACFCPPEMNRWTRVSVVDGTVVAAVAVEPDPNFPINDIRYWKPIDSLLVDLYRTMTDPGASSFLDAIIVDYDRDLGYPTSIEYRARRNIADGGSIQSLRNVQPLVADRRQPDSRFH